MASNKFQDLRSDDYVMNILSKMQDIESSYKGDNEKVLRVLIDLTDELRRSNLYTNKHRELIFREVDSRIGKTSL